jgi:hypothetical protein
LEAKVPLGKVKTNSGLGAATNSSETLSGWPTCTNLSVPRRSRLIFGLMNLVSARIGFELAEHSDSPP